MRIQSVRNVLNPIPFTNTQCDYIKYYTNDLSELIFFLAKTVDCHLTHRDFGISDKYRRWGISTENKFVWGKTRIKRSQLWKYSPNFHSEEWIRAKKSEKGIANSQKWSWKAFEEEWGNSKHPHRSKDFVSLKKTSTKRKNKSIINPDSTNFDWLHEPYFSGLEIFFRRLTVNRINCLWTIW